MQKLILTVCILAMMLTSPYIAYTMLDAIEDYKTTQAELIRR